MRTPDLYRCVLLIVPLVTLPSITHGEPLTLISGRFFIDHPETEVAIGSSTFMRASGPTATVDIFFAEGNYISPPSANDGFLDPSFSFGVEVLGADIRIGDRLLHRDLSLVSPWKLNVSITGPQVPLDPPPPDEDGRVNIRFPGLFRGSLSGVSDGEPFTIELSGRGRGSFNALDPAETGRFAPIESFFDFEESAPIPEPGTILLISAAGIAGLTTRKRR